ncbi:MAG: DUF1761 domain-containing protein [Bacteroidota bacterium]|nr:DUF1761 domain-containing protein [Bacteroidota bacterium]
MGELQINSFAVIVAAILNMVVGAIWYGPMLFAKQWMAVNNINPEEMKNVNPMPMYAQSIVVTIVSYWVLAMAITITNAVTVSGGMSVAFWLWIGFIAPVQYTANLFSSKKILAFFLDTGYQLVTMLIAGGLLAVWR